MHVIVSDERIISLERALDEALSLGTRPRYCHVRHGRVAPPLSPESHTSLVMRALYREAAAQGDLVAPLAGAMTFYQLLAATKLTGRDLDLAINELILNQRRLRSRDEGLGRVYFLPAFLRGVLRKALRSGAPADLGDLAA
jgi:hypothetical protein